MATQNLLKNREFGAQNLKKIFDDAKSDYSVHQVEEALALKTLEEWAIPSGHMLGAFVLNTGGITISNGLRILGSPSDETRRSLLGWNQELKTLPQGYLLVGDDIFGGFYAVNLGGFGNNLGEVFALLPDSTEWESLFDDFGHFLFGALNGAFETVSISYSEFDDFFELRGSCKDNQAINFYPPLYTKEGSPKNSSKKLIDIKELFCFRKDLLDWFLN